MDMSPIRGVPAARPTSDAVSGLVAYSAVATVLAEARAARGGGGDTGGGGGVGGGYGDDTMRRDDALDISRELQGRATEPGHSFPYQLNCQPSQQWFCT